MKLRRDTSCRTSWIAETGKIDAPLLLLEVEAAPNHVQPFYGSGVFDLEIIIYRSTMFDTVQGDQSLFVVNPQEDAIVADAVFLKAFEVFRWMFQGEFEGFRMMAEPFQLLHDPRSNVTVQSLQVGIELRGRRYSIHSSFLTSLRGRVFPDR